MKRFYEDVAIAQNEGGWQVTLDGRAVKTVKGSQQVVPSEALAKALAQEWAGQGEEIDTAQFVFRDLADYALDIVAAARGETVTKLLAYGETDTLCYRADPEDALYAKQQEVWEPLLESLEGELGARFTRISGIIHKPQSESVLAALKERLEQQTPLALAALENMASLSASLSIAMLANAPDADAQALWDAASLEEEWQAELWGRDYEAEERREKRRNAFLKSHEFLTLARA